MRYLSLFSGIEAATQAWQPLGWECVGVSEIEPFPCAVLAHHYPDVPNLGDVTKITEQQIKDLGQIDLVVFGSPCQNLSVAGNRKGFDGEQSSLFYDSIRIIQYARKHCGARFALWENVPGAFSSNKGADFAAVVEQMAGLSDVDVPTNGWGKEGAAVGENGLLEWSVLDAQWFGLAQRRKRVFAIVDFGDWASRPPILLERESLRGDPAPSRETRESVAADVGASATKRGFDKQRIGQYADNNVASTCAARDYKDATDLVVEPVAYPINTMTCQGRPSDNGRMGLGLGDNGDPCPTITSAHSHAVAFALNNDTTPKFCEELSMTLKIGGQGGSNAIVSTGSVVRRLTPKEAERLQGFPDNFTQIPYRNKSADDCPNGVRYKALGNSMAVNVMVWIGQKIQQAVAIKVYGV